MLCTPGPLSVRVHPRGIPLTPWRRTPTELLDFSAFIPGSDWWRKSGWAADCALSKQNKIYTVMLWCLMTRKSLRFDLNQFGCIQVSFKRVLWQAKQKGPSKQLLLNCNTDKVISNIVKWMYELRALATRVSKYNDANIMQEFICDLRFSMLFFCKCAEVCWSVLWIYSFLACHHSITDFEINAFLNQDSYRLLKSVSD